MIKRITQNKGFAIHLPLLSDHPAERFRKILFLTDKGKITITTERVPQQAAAGTIGRLPAQKDRQILIEPAPSDNGFHPESAHELRQLGDVSENIGHIPDTPRLRTIFPRQFCAAKKIPDQSFPGNQQLIGHQIPRPDLQTPLRNLRFQPRHQFRPDLRNILQNNSLTVKHKTLIRRIIFQRVKNLFRLFQQHSAEILKRTVPLPVPMTGCKIAELHNGSFP